MGGARMHCEVSGCGDRLCKSEEEALHAARDYLAFLPQHAEDRPPDVPGFMIGKKVEREGIIRHGAKMISAVSEAVVPKISVVLRKAYGAGLYAMCGSGFEPDACLALPQAMIAVMGPEAAVNAVFYNKIQDTPEAERSALVERLRDEYKKDIDVFRLAADLHIDGIVAGDDLRDELIRRFAHAAGKRAWTYPKRRSVLPV
jgi:acetyl-CoA carboxylase carboxyltransferase component